MSIATSDLSESVET